MECVPNFSEGRDSGTVDEIVLSIANVGGAAFLDRTSDFDHHRTVITFAGSPGTVEEAAFQAVAAAVRCIDLREHAGVHPRIGVADVVPFVPVRGISLAECAGMAERLALKIWTRLQVPVYLYEAAARRPECRRLENIRKFASSLPPDVGEGRHATAGAVVVGARPFLIAWNIQLATADITIARRIAREIRESSGGLQCVKAMGLELVSRGITQVAINLTDFERTPLHMVFEMVKRRAEASGVHLIGSELIGLIPERALAPSADHDLQWQNLTEESVLENRLRAVGQLE